LRSAAAILEYPAIDVLRYTRFSAGHNWQEEYGVPADADDVRAMLRYAPIQNARSGLCYPATLVAPGERDQTAAPMHAYKFVATLQHAQECSRPILLRESWGAGHTAGATLADAIGNWTDQLLFAREALSGGDLHSSAK
jgi:prolyl oligopeptidase